MKIARSPEPTAQSALQLVEHRQIGGARRNGEALVGKVGDRDQTEMRVLAVNGPTGQRLVGILEPEGTDEIGIIRDRTKIKGVGGAAFLLPADPDETLPNSPRSARPK